MVEYLFNDYFDRISLLSLVDREDRREYIKWQNKRIACLWYPRTLDLHLSVRHPFGMEIGKIFSMTKPNEYSVAREHYAIVKLAYEMGYNNLLVMEDDLCFHKSKDLWKLCLSNIPEDYDILSFNGFTADKSVVNYLQNESDVNKNNIWSPRYDIGLWNMGMVAFSRTGMEYYLYCQEKRFYVADYPIYITPLNKECINAYMTTVPMAIQEDKNVLSSDVRNSENDNIDYNNENCYESLIIRMNYFNYTEYGK